MSVGISVMYKNMYVIYYDLKDYMVSILLGVWIRTEQVLRVKGEAIKTFECYQL